MQKKPGFGLSIVLRTLQPGAMRLASLYLKQFMFNSLTVLFGRLRPACAGIRQLGASRMTTVILVGAVLAVTVGCSKKEQSQASPTPPSADSASQPAPPAQTTPTPSVPQSANSLVQADGQTDMGEVQRGVIRWILGPHRRP